MTNPVNNTASCWLVGGIDNNAGRGQKFFSITGIKPSLHRHKFAGTIESCHSGRQYCSFRLANIALAKSNLAVEIAGFYCIAINTSDSPDSSRRQIQHQRNTDASRPHHHH